jgi:hypothetical protein
MSEISLFGDGLLPSSTCCFSGSLTIAESSGSMSKNIRSSEHWYAR